MILENKQIRMDHVGIASLAKIDVPQKTSASSDGLRKKKKGGSTSLMWVSFMGPCVPSVFVAPFGEVRKSTRIPRTSMWILAKMEGLPSLKKGHTVDGRNVAPVWHLSNPSKHEDIIFPQPSKSYLINYDWNKPSSSYQRPFQGNIFHKKREGGFLAPAVRNKLRGAIGPISPLLETSCQANCLVNVHTWWMLQHEMSWGLNVAYGEKLCGLLPGNCIHGG